MIRKGKLPSTQQHRIDATFLSFPISAEPAMSFATSFTSTFSQSQTSLKQIRTSQSPLSNSQPRKKTGRAKGRAPAVRLGERPDPPQGSASSGSAVLQPTFAEEYWTWSDNQAEL